MIAQVRTPPSEKAALLLVVQRGDERGLTDAWESGRLRQQFDTAYGADRLMTDVVLSFLRGVWSDEQAKTWWPRLWEAGAKERPHRHALWLSVGVLHPISCNFLLAQGASPHARPLKSPRKNPRQPHRESENASAFVNALEAWLRYPGRAPASLPGFRWSPEQLEELLERLWRVPGIRADQAETGLTLIADAALRAPPDEERDAVLARWRDRLLPHAPQERLQQRLHSLFWTWLMALPEHTDAARCARWQAWGRALLADPPSTPPTAQPLILRGMDDLLHPSLVPFWEPLARWGFTPWREMRHLSSEAHDPARLGVSTSLGSLIPRNGWPCPTPSVPPGWWDAMEHAAAFHPAPASWQAGALQSWLAVTLLPPSQNQPPVEPDADWVVLWDTWVRLGRWQETGVPEPVKAVLVAWGGTLKTLPNATLDALCCTWQKCGLLRDLILPQRDASELSYASGFARNGRWELWNRFRGDAALHEWLFRAIGPEDAPLLLAALLFDPVRQPVAPAAFLTTLLKRRPEWASDHLWILDHAVSNRQWAAAAAILESGLTPQSWKTWSQTFQSLRQASPARSHPETLAGGGSCVLMALALQMHANGLAWQAGPPSQWPLVQLLRWGPVVPETSTAGLQRLIDANADVTAGLRHVKALGGTENAWRSVAQAHLLGDAAPEAPAVRRRVRL